MSKLTLNRNVLFDFPPHGLLSQRRSFRSDAATLWWQRRGERGQLYNVARFSSCINSSSNVRDSKNRAWRSSNLAYLWTDSAGSSALKDRKRLGFRRYSTESRDNFPKEGLSEGLPQEEGIEYEEIEIELPERCSGCGVRLQQERPDLPGYFQVPKRLLEILSNPAGYEADEADEDLEFQNEDILVGESEGSVEGAKQEDEWNQFDKMVESWLEDYDENEENEMAAPRNKKKSNTLDKPEPKSFMNESLDDEATEIDHLLSEVLCARCYSLRHYGKVKNAEAEERLPGFDFAKLVGQRIALQKFRREIVLVVVDLADFDGSLPRTAIRSILPAGFLEYGDISRRLPPGFRLVIAANKSDLLPKEATKKRLEAWVRKRIAQGGLPRPSAVHIVSSERGLGIKGLLAELQYAVGNRGDVWVVGAQNAGKSSLLNAMSRSVNLPSSSSVTAAHVPGTTLGIVRVPGLLPRGCKMLDTPGVPHKHQISSILSAEEMRLLLPRRPLTPRTYRIGVGQSVTIGGISRVDVLECPGATMYLTVWVSEQVVCHLGKTDLAENLLSKHHGTKLIPPIGDEQRINSFPSLQPTEVTVHGSNWKKCDVDVAIAGVGWVGIGLNGDALLRVWAPPGVAVTTRDALVPDFAKELQKPGFDRIGESMSKRSITSVKGQKKKK